MVVIDLERKLLVGMAPWAAIPSRRPGPPGCDTGAISEGIGKGPEQTDGQS
jgi:hypothetical protein